MRCPYCGSELRRGWLAARSGVMFTERETWWDRDEADTRRGEVQLIDRYWPNLRTPAYWCDACETLVWNRQEAQR